MNLPRFYPIIDTAVIATSLFKPIEVAEEAIAAGAKILQYRHKDNWTQTAFNEAKVIGELCRQANIPFIVNDRADFAKLLNAGLHIGQDDLPAPAARQIVGSVIIGFSTHNAPQLKRAVGSPVDYLSLGPIFETKSKEKPDPVVGVDGLKKLRPLTDKPLVAIGGITLENAESVFATGANSVAIISGILIPEASRSLLRQRLTAWCAL